MNNASSRLWVWYAIRPEMQSTPGVSTISRLQYLNLHLTKLAYQFNLPWVIFEPWGRITSLDIFYSLTWNNDLCPWPSNVSRVKTYQHAKHLGQRSFVRELSFGQTDRLVEWQSGKKSVFGRRIFPILRSTCSWWVTTYVGKPSATGQSTRPTQPFILSRSINWVVSSNRMLASSHGWRRLVNAYGVKAWCGSVERWCVC